MEPTGGIHFGATPVPTDDRVATGGLIRAFGEACYVIEDVQALEPFLVTVVSDSDLWLFATSNGGVTAGRRSPATALFPYVTEDALADSPGVTGPATSVVVGLAGRRMLWHPLSEGDRKVYRIRRRLLKNVLGTRLVFEEENEDLGLCFRASWRASDRYGFVRECTLSNRSRAPLAVALLDGLLNLLPGDADEQLQREASVLLDAYKQSERVAETPLAVYTLAAQPVDRPEPREALHATTVWSWGLPRARIHLDAAARAAFDAGRSPAPSPATRGVRGAYLAEAAFELAPGEEHGWVVVADVARTQLDVARLVEALGRPEALVDDVLEDAAQGSAHVEEMVAATDGRQTTADALRSAHHLSNVLFNDLRGGVYAYGSHVPGRDFEAFVRAANRVVWARHASLLAALPELETREAHEARVEAVGDPHLSRLSAEYLPVWFSRRHGDPSRPWNRFEIQVRDARGAPVLDYQGNWRDIFQNWEALSRSFPDFVEQILTKFVDASTADGHNPYRIGRAGLDWEVPDPSHPWSTIGYWGDHQIVYLLRLLELSLSHHPRRLPALLERPLFTYADVPYAFRPFPEILANPRASLRFDPERHARILARERELGSDGRLLQAEDGPLQVTLVEKLIVTALAKLAAFVPGGGIWMNTQRPEWNDANNALAGYGVSVVTLAHLDRYLEVLEGLLRPLDGGTTPLSREVVSWLDAMLEVLRAHRAAAAEDDVDDETRFALMTALGETAAAYRDGVYRRGFSGTVPVPVERLVGLVSLARPFLRQAIRLARRKDGLFHAYHVLVPQRAGVGLRHLPEMLEGQVAALSTHAVDDEAACDLLDALWESRLYRADQHSFLLYPDRRLPGFLEKNVVPEEALRGAPVLARLLAEGGGRVLSRDAAGRLRFSADLPNADALRAVLRELRAGGFPGLDEAGSAQVEAIYERVFDHRAFTGRSGTMFAYEGLGSIYWHMVGKLLLAVQERYVEAAERGAPARILERLAVHYARIREGMGGVAKSPALWGAFPLDAYSHTPAGSGARQPGMTGQVKEEILIRLGELGVRVQEGRLAFRPRLLRPDELLDAPDTLEAVHVDGRRERIALTPGTLAFTICQVPVVYRRSAERRLVVTGAEGGGRTFEGDTLDEGTSAEIFSRSGRVRRIDVWTAPAGPGSASSS